MRCRLVALTCWVALITLVVTACSRSSEEGRSAASASSPSATSVVYDGTGYRFVAPAGWTVKPRVGSWQKGVSPARDTTGFDRFTSPEGDPWLVIGRRAAPRGISLQNWLKQMTRTRTITYGETTCVPPESTAPVTIGGDAAQLRWFHCPVDGPDAVGVHVLSVQGDHGFIVMCYTEHAGPVPEFTADCQHWLEGFRYAS